MKNHFVIYDEIDNMANPLTNELNIPNSDAKIKIPYHDTMYRCADRLFSLMSDEGFFKSHPANMPVFNGKHCYFNIWNQEIKQAIFLSYMGLGGSGDETIDRYIAENVLQFSNQKPKDDMSMLLLST